MTALGRWLKLSYRLQRWEVLAAVLGSAAAVGTMLWLGIQLGALTQAHPQCADPATVAAGCEQFAKQFSELADWGSQLLRISWAAPFGMGVVLGVPLVSREVEHRTAALAWTLGRSRLRWLVERIAFVVLLALVLLAAIGIASELLAAAMAPDRTLTADFTWYGRRGALLIPRGMLALGIGVCAGALIGRTLPALLVAAFASALVFTGLSQGMDRWNAADAIAQRYGIYDPAALSVGQRLMLPGGALVDAAYLGEFSNIAIDADGAVFTRFDEQTGEPDRSSFIGFERELVLPADRYPQVVARESAAAGGLALLAMLATGAIVSRQRPGA